MNKEPRRPRPVFVPGSLGNSIHLADWGGEGPPILLLHGMGGNSHWWDLSARTLSSRCRVVAMDFRGHGDSAWVEPPRYQIGDYVSDIEAVREALGWDRFFLAAHSMGARAAIHYAALYPGRVRRLALLDFLTSLRNRSHLRYERAMRRSQPTYAALDIMVEKFRLQPAGTALPRPLVDRLAADSCRRREDGRWTWKFDWRGFYFEYPPVWEGLGAIRMPCLVMRGEYSTILPREGFDQVLLALPDGSGVEIQGGFHHIPLDDPEGVAGALLEFLGKNNGKLL